MKELRNFIKTYKYPKHLNNPNIEDIIEYNGLMNEELSYFDIKNIEGLLWHDKRGPKYDIIQENVIYENILKSYKSEKLLNKITKKFGNYLYDGIEVNAVTKTNSLTLFISDNKLVNDEEFKSLLNLYNYYVSFCEDRKYYDIKYYEVYIEPYKPKEMTDYIYNDCKGIVYRFVNDNGLKRLNHHGLVPRHDNDRYYPRYIFVVADKDKNELKETLTKVQGEIKKLNIHLIKIDLNKYENKLKFYKDPASVNYEAFVTREYIPKYCCEETDINNL